MAAPSPPSEAAWWNPRWGRSVDYNYLMSTWFRDVPFDVVHLPERGRFQIAKRDLPSGSNVVRSFPYCYAVCHEVKTQVCQYCFGNSIESGAPEGSVPTALPIECQQCHEVWYCSERCRELDAVQHDLECYVLKIFFAAVNWDEPGNCTEIKLLLRTMSRRLIERKDLHWPEGHCLRGDPMRFEDFFRLTHSRENFGETLTDSLRDIVEYLKTLDTWLEDIDLDSLLDVVLKTRNNMFNVFKSSADSLGWGVYVESSLFNHSCMPNCCLFRNHADPAFQFVTIQPVAAGEELTITYLGYGDLESRRSHLKEHYFFHCDCARCVEEEGGSTKKYDEWYQNYHCHNEGCLGYDVTFTLPDGTTERRCNYCSFLTEEVEGKGDAAPKKPVEAK